MAADVLVDLGTGMAIIGVMIVLFLRADSRIDKVDAKFESRFDAMATCMPVMGLHLRGATGPFLSPTSISLRPATARPDSTIRSDATHLAGVRTTPQGHWRC